MMSDRQLREELAAYAHDAWSGWMERLFSKCQRLPEYCYHSAIPPKLADRWRRQINTPYSEIPESEKESDRKEADKILAIMEQCETLSQAQKTLRAIYSVGLENRHDPDLVADLVWHWAEIRKGL